MYPAQRARLMSQIECIVPLSYACRLTGLPCYSFRLGLLNGCPDRASPAISPIGSWRHALLGYVALWKSRRDGSVKSRRGGTARQGVHETVVRLACLGMLLLTLTSCALNTEAFGRPSRTPVTAAPTSETVRSMLPAPVATEIPSPVPQPTPTEEQVAFNGWMADYRPNWMGFVLYIGPQSFLGSTIVAGTEIIVTPDGRGGTRQATSTIDVSCCKLGTVLTVSQVQSDGSIVEYTFRPATQNDWNRALAAWQQDLASAYASQQQAAAENASSALQSAVAANAVGVPAAAFSPADVSVAIGSAQQQITNSAAALQQAQAQAATFANGREC